MQTLLLPASIVIAALAIGAIVQFLVHPRVMQQPAVRSRPWLWMVLDLAGVCYMLWVAALGIYVATDLTSRTPTVMHLLDDALLVLVLASFTIVAARFAGAAVLRLSRGPEQQLASGTLFATVSQALVVIIGVIIILDSLGIRVTPLLTALGVGGLAVALALQPPLANLFSGLQLVASREIRPGDYVQLQSGQQGFVEGINWRSVSIREPSNNLVVVPNQVIAQTVFTNFRLPEPQVAAKVSLRVAYGSDLDLVEKLALEAVQITRHGMDGAETSSDAWVRFEELGDSGVGLAVNFYVPRIVDQQLAKSAFLRAFYKLLQHRGIDTPTTKPIISAPANAPS
jgi:small-conductance mechanosensitive channel